MLSDDYAGLKRGAEIAVHPNGRYLYASNREHKSIAIFAIDGVTGKLTGMDRVCGSREDSTQTSPSIPTASSCSPRARIRIPSPCWHRPALRLVNAFWTPRRSARSGLDRLRAAALSAQSYLPGLAGNFASGFMSPWNIRVTSPASLRYQSLGSSAPSASSVNQKP
jgi:hypothetical protein